MKPTDTCWGCKHLASRPHAFPPVFCKAYPAGDGIPFQILAGQVRHDHLVGDERSPVFFERIEGGRE